MGARQWMAQDVNNTSEERNTAPTYAHEVASNNTKDVSSLPETNINILGDHSTQSETEDMHGGVDPSATSTDPSGTVACCDH